MYVKYVVVMRTVLNSRADRGEEGGGVYKVGASTFREQFAVCTKIYLVQSKFEGTG